MDAELPPNQITKQSKTLTDIGLVIQAEQAWRNVAVQSAEIVS